MKKQLFASVVLSTFALVSAFAQETTLPDSIALSNEEHHFATTKAPFTKAPSECITDITNTYIAYLFYGTNKTSFEKSWIEVYEIASQRKLWQMKYHPKATHIEMTNYGLVEMLNGRGMRLYDYNTGKRLWKVSAPNCCGVIDDKGFVSEMETNIWAISLKNGKKLWRTDFCFVNGLSASYDIDAIHSFLAMDQLYMLNWETGQYLSTNIKTNDGNNGNVAGNIYLFEFGIGYGVANPSNYKTIPIIRNHTTNKTNTELLLPPNNLLNSALTSNIVRDRNKFYFADKNNIMCFDKGFKFFWKTKYTEENATRSELVLVGDNIYQLNFGFGISDLKPTKYGHAYIAGYKASDGTEIFHKRLFDKMKMALSVNIDKEKACMLFDDAMSSVYFADNSVNTIHCDTTSYGAFAGFVNANEELICRDGYLRLIKNVTKHPAVYTTRNRVLEVSPTTGKLTKLNAEGFFRIIGKCGKMTIIRGGEEDKELWCIEDGKATNLSNNADKVWVKNYLVSVITHAGTSILIHLDKTI
ncbi:MAG: hypothetical protein J5663_10005 [Bacteroidaceae bacterium]|nr:hypothetical protein [Bacteroidaceae bacterium]